MKKLLVCLGLLLLVPGLALAQADPFGYYVGYFANNPGPAAGAADQVVRIINTGTLGTPLTSPAFGDICADIYVFDNNQEMIACCAERITPDELDSAAVGAQLTANPLTSVVPAAGVFKILTTVVPAGGCNPTAVALPLADASVFSTHLQVTGGRTFVTETFDIGSPLSVAEFTFLQQACSFTLYLGSGKGTCSSSVPGH
jgi:hypothetical protein